MNSNVNRGIECEWGMPEPQDMTPIQRNYDDRMIRALAKGLLRQMNPETGRTEIADRYYAPTRDDSKTNRLGIWVTQADAQLETGLQPAEIDNVVYIRTEQEIGEAA